LLLYRLHKALVRQFVAETADQLQSYGLDQPDLKLGLWEGPKLLKSSSSRKLLGRVSNQSRFTRKLTLAKASFS